jgi:De-etiolated protein 1 Det1
VSYCTHARHGKPQRGGRYANGHLYEVYCQVVTHAAACSCRFLTPAGTPASARAAVDRQMAHQYWTMQQVAPRDEPPALDTLVDGLNALDALECALQQPDSGVLPGHLHVFLPAFLAKPSCWVTQVTRRVLAAIPPSSQMLCASPYLDACLFQYDEKHISPTVRPRALAEVCVSFAALLP